MQFGGIPRARQFTIDATGRFVQFDQLSMHVMLKGDGGALRLFFTQSSFDDDTDYYELPAGEVFNGPMEDRGVWLKAAGANVDVQMVVFHRKG